ncbi:MAG: Hsp20/alpha crystallin family protein [Syntrophales bacterium]|nr:Hsp20/alpha crystallin family protein [Syntrophales bacterium]
MSYIKIKFHKEQQTENEETVDFLQGTILVSSTSLFSLGTNTWRPHVDMYETPDEILMLVDLAGVRKEDIHLEVSQRKVKIYGKRDHNFLPGTIRYHLAEIPYGYFERQLTFSEPIDLENIEAVYSNGLLEIHIPKRKEEDVRKRVPITKP